MLQRLMNRKVVIGLLGILILLAAFGRIMTTPAEEYRFVTGNFSVVTHFS